MAAAGQIDFGLSLDTVTPAQKIAAYARNMENPSLTMGILRDAAQAWQFDIIKNEGAVEGNPRWAPNAASTIRGKHGNRVLYNTGTLMSALLDQPRVSGWTASIRGPAYLLWVIRGGRNTSVVPSQEHVDQVGRKMLTAVVAGFDR